MINSKEEGKWNENKCRRPLCNIFRFAVVAEVDNRKTLISHEY